MATQKYWPIEYGHHADARNNSIAIGHGAKALADESLVINATGKEVKATSSGQIIFMAANEDGENIGFEISPTDGLVVHDQTGTAKISAVDLGNLAAAGAAPTLISDWAEASDENVPNSNLVKESLTTLSAEIVNDLGGGVYYKGQAQIVDANNLGVSDAEAGWMYLIAGDKFIDVDNIRYQKGDFFIVKTSVTGVVKASDVDFINSQDDTVIHEDQLNQVSSALVGFIDTKIDEHDKSSEAHSDIRDNIDAITQTISTKADQTALNELSTKVQTNTTNISGLSTAKADLSVLNTVSSNLNTSITDLDERLDVVETTLTSKVDNTTFTTLSNSVQTNTTDIGTLKTSKANQSDLTIVSSNGLSLSSKIDTVSTNVSSISSSLNSKANQSSLTELSNKVNALDTSTTQISSELTATKNALTSKADKTEITTISSVLSAKADSSAVVHLTGEETIRGKKTFENLPSYSGIASPASTNLVTYGIVTAYTNDLISGATATIDDTAGTPAVTVTITGDSKKSFNFAFTGLKGEQGEQGIQGQAGPAGPVGTNGITPTFSAVSVTMIDSAAVPSASITGDPTALVLNLSIPKGEKGADGSDATVTVDSSLNVSSENPVQNKVITAVIEELSSKLGEISALLATV